ncbi:MAG: protein phosphatase 2C domain-containing protein [Victivallaceae bacterium]
MQVFPQNNIESFAVTDMGKVRKNNEDALLAIPNLGCFLISDGMGGGKAGEVASGMMVNEIEKDFAALAGGATPGEREGAFIRAAYRVNFAIKDYAEAHNYSSMGATVVALVLDPWHFDTASIFHAGDSRAYRIRNNQLEQLMVDHSVAASSNLPESKIAPMFRGVLTNALGTGNEFFLERNNIDLQEDDLFLLCSDGLTRMVKDPEIMQLYNSIRNEPVNIIGKVLLQAALERGGRDNVSVIIVRVKKIAAPYTPSEGEVNKESDAQLRNLMDLTDTPPTEVVWDTAFFKHKKSN